MNIEAGVIDTLEELEAFVKAVESGVLGLEGVVGIGMAISNKDGRPFVAVFGEGHKLLLGRWLSQAVYENGKGIVQGGSKQQH